MTEGGDSRSGSCSFEFDPAEWFSGRAAAPGRPDSVEDVWECPHDAVGEQNFCIFHLPPEEKEDSEAKEAFLDMLASDREDRILGAKFGDLDLRYEDLGEDTLTPLDISFIQVEGRLDLSSARLNRPLILRRGTFESVHLDDAQFEKECRFTQARFTGTFSVQNAVFQDTLELREARFDGIATFEDATVRGRLDCQRVLFQDVQLLGSTFGGPANFEEMSCMGTFDAESTQFQDSVLFQTAKFSGECNFSNVSFRGDARFSESLFESSATFQYSEFQNLASFDDSEFHQTAVFTDTLFVKTATFEGVRLGSDLKIRGARFQRQCQFEFASTTEEFRIVDCSDAQLSKGYIQTGDDQRVLYNLENASLGDFHLEVEAGSSLFEMFRFAMTRFDGFDFGQYTNELTIEDFAIHGIHSSVENRFTALSAAELESTYLKARNGAADVGATDIQSEFFIKQMHYRRRQYFDRIFTGNISLSTRLLAFNRWLIGTGLSFSCGYGERPDRVFAASGIVIAAYASVYEFLSVPMPFPGDFAIDPILFSLQAFAALLVGAPPTVSRMLTIIVVSEALIGALVIALLVVTLTRAFDTDR